MMLKLIRVTLVLLYVFCIGCNSTKKLNTDYIYFQKGQDTIAVKHVIPVVRPNEVLNIFVSSRTQNQDQVSVFNPPISPDGIKHGYPVNQDGIIEFPILGNLNVGGLTKNEVQNLISEKISLYVKNPSVSVSLLNFQVNILGEVHSPGTRQFTSETVSIIDAIGAAGDLTDYGKREDVTVLRTEKNQRVYYKIDLRRKDFMNSPVFMVQPNDVIYVGPVKNKLRNLSVNPDSQRKTGVVLALTSVAVSIASLVVSFLR